MTSQPFLSRISSRLNALDKGNQESRYTQVMEHLNNPAPSVHPSYLHTSQDILSLFCEKAQKAGSSCHHAHSYLNIPHIIKNIIQPREALTLYLPSLPWLQNLSWHSLMTISHENPDIHALWGLSLASSAAAETGTVFVSSSSSSPITLNFVPEKSIVLLQLSTLFPSLEEAMDTAHSSCPRALSLVTGPSRTADIAQQLVMGAHGPKSLDIILFTQP